MGYFIKCVLLLLCFIPTGTFGDVLIHKATTQITLSGNLDAGTPTFNAPIPAPSLAVSPTGSTAVTYADLDQNAAYSLNITVFDSLGQSHVVHFYFFHTDTSQHVMRAYVNTEDVGDGPTGYPRQLVRIGGTNPGSGNVDIIFDINGNKINNTNPDIIFAIPWTGGAAMHSIAVTLNPVTQLFFTSTVTGTQDGFAPILVTPTTTLTSIPGETPTPTITPTITPTATPSMTPTLNPPVIPKALKVRQDRRLTLFTMGPPGGAAYLLELRNSARTTTFESSDRTPVLHNLERRPWSARYRIRLPDGSYSEYSDWVKFRIR